MKNLKIINSFGVGVKIKKSWIVIGIIILLVVCYFVLKSVFKNPTAGYVTEKVSKGDVLQEISETGSVKATENITLGFKTAGKIAKIHVAVGDNVKKGNVLAELDSTQLLAQLQNAKAALDVANNQYNKLVNGLTPEDIKTYENAVTDAKNDLKSAYDSALNSLRDAYTKIYNAYTAATSIQNDYFSASDQEGIKVQDAKKDINNNLQNVKNYLDTAEKSSAKEDIDSAISQTLLALDNVYNDFKIIREQCDEGIYYSKVSSTDKASLDTQKGYINTALTNVTTSQQTIASDKIALQKAEDNLALKTASARTEDIDIYKAQIQQAQANVDLYQSQLNDNYLKSPIDAKITAINAKRGEVVAANQSVINLLSSEPFQIKVDIYEQDIVKVKMGDTAKITLVAFPKQTFEGKVLSIDPAEKIVDNVVYYEVTIDFPNQPNDVKSGMTADIVIETNKKDSVLRVPKNAIENVDGKNIVQVIVNKDKIENRQITTGLEGNDYYEVVSGLSEGDTIIVGKK